MILVFFLEVLQRFLGFLENIFAPGEELHAKIFALALVHERLLVGWPIAFVFGQHSGVLPDFLFLGALFAPSRGRLIYANYRADNIPVRQRHVPDFGDTSMTSVGWFGNPKTPPSSGRPCIDPARASTLAGF